MIFVLAAALVTGAATTYDMSERCGIRAQQVYGESITQKPIPPGPDTYEVKTYSSHYNPAVNKCLAWVNTFHLKGGVTEYMFEQIIDVNEQSVEASMSKYTNSPPDLCMISQFKCTSQDEFELFAKAAMGRQ